MIVNVVFGIGISITLSGLYFAMIQWVVSGNIVIGFLIAMFGALLFTTALAMIFWKGLKG